MQAFTAFLSALMSIFGVVNKASKSLEIVADQTMLGLAQSRNEAATKYKTFMDSDAGMPEKDVNQIINDLMDS
jgi:hypothetical protein